MKRKQPFTYDEFKAIYSKVPRLCVDLVIKNKNGYLLTLRKKNGYEGLWHLPGGTVYYREHAPDAVKRIAKEELGTRVAIQKFIGFLEYPSEEKERGFGYSVSLLFLCKLTSSSLNLDDQAERVEFFKTIPENTIYEQRCLLDQLLKK
jgi:ADP-ribose pyrophosphatase YjhB (NUDIX family)